MKIHIVQQGDTLWKLAKKYDVGFEQLKVVNSHLSNPDVIMPGMKIKIPTGGVPVKKQMAKKEEPIQVKEQPIAKEAPKKEVKMPEKPVPPVVQPPMLTPQQYEQYQYEQHLHNMNMNFNIYKPMPAPIAPVTPAPKVPAPPKMPDMVLPKVEKPKPMPKPMPMPMPKPKPMPMAPPPVPPKKEVPKVDKMAMEKQMLPPMPPCYPVTGIMPGYGYQVPPAVYPYQQGYPQYPPMSQQMGSYGYPAGAVASAKVGYIPAPFGGYQGQQNVYQQPMMPYYQVGYGMGQPPVPPVPPYSMAPQAQQWTPQTNIDMDDDFDNEYATGIPKMVPNANMPMPPNYWGQPNFYGDVTMAQQMPLGQQVPQMPMPPQQWGYQQQPMRSQQPPSSPHPAQHHIEEEETD